MPRKRREQDLIGAVEEPRSKRARPQPGFYPILLKGRVPWEKKSSSKKYPDTTPVSKLDLGEGQNDGGEGQSGDEGQMTAQVQCSSSGTMYSDPHPSTHASHSGLSSTDSMDGGETTIATMLGQEEQVVVAVIEDDVVPMSMATAFLHQKVLPQQPGDVQVEQTENQLTIKGSIEQVQQVLNSLAQIKKKASAQMAPEEFGTGDSTSADVYVESGCNFVPCHDMPSTAEDAVKEEINTISYDEKVIYVEDDNGVGLEVKVAVPATQLSSDITSGNKSKIFTEAENAASGPVSECSTDVNTGELGSGGGEFITYTQNRTATLIDADAAKGLIENGLSPQPDSNSCQKEKSSARELLNQFLAATSEHGQGSESHIERNNSDQSVPVSLPGLLPLLTAHCSVCDDALDEKDVKNHMEVQHGSREEACRCDVCNLVFPDKRTLLLHLRVKHEDVNFTCKICGKKFQCQRYLRTHLQRHAGFKKFECPQCGWRFFERHKLKFHMELHKAESERCLPYRCELCGKQFPNKASWSDHCNTHSGNRPFECDVCGATFGHRIGLRRHKWTHEKVKPFSCSMCSKTFAVKSKLTEHMITHTGFSKHVCCHCDKVFTAASSLKRHQAKCSASITLGTTQDSNSEPNLDLSAAELSGSQDTDLDSVFLCGVCNLGFSSYDEAERHTMIHQVAVDSEDCVGTADTVTTDASEVSSLAVLRQAEGSEVEVTHVQYVAEEDVRSVVVSEAFDNQYIIIRNVDKPSTEPAEEYSGEAVQVEGEIISQASSRGEITVSVEELEQIQLAASTLADLSSK